MARGRKANYINKITNKDSQMLRAFRNCGYLNTKMLKDELGQADRRIKNFERDKYIEKVTYIDKATKNSDWAYRLTDRGRDLCRQQGLDNFYRSNSKEHDIGLADRYFSIREEERTSWQTEQDTRDEIYRLYEQDPDRYQEFYEKMESREISIPDGVYTSLSGEVIAIEITTRNYRDEDIQAKIEACEALNMQLELYRV